MKIALGLVDNHPSLIKPFALSLINLIRFFDRWVADNGIETELIVISADAGGIDDMRNTIAEQAIENGCDYIFWTDTDQTFPPDCLPRLLGYCERDGYEAVTGLYTHKYPPYLPHAYPKLVEENQKFALPTSFPLNQPFIVEGAGFGCLLMKTSVFERVSKPYFTMRFEAGKMVEGEDLPFCIRAKMKMLLDPSVRCGHLRMAQFGIQEFIKTNEIEVKDEWVYPTPQQRVKMQEMMNGLIK